MHFQSVTKGRWNSLRGGILALLLVISIAGCHVYNQEYRTLLNETSKFSSRLDHKKTLKSNQISARDAFIDIMAVSSRSTISIDFEDGFIEGYADYMTYGGDGLPPIIPNRKYWNSNYRNLYGNQAINDWQNGFSSGANAAKASSIREFQTIPLSYSEESAFSNESYLIAEPIFPKDKTEAIEHRNNKQIHELPNPISDFKNLPLSEFDFSEEE